MSGAAPPGSGEGSSAEGDPLEPLGLPQTLRGHSARGHPGTTSLLRVRLTPSPRHGCPCPASSAAGEEKESGQLRANAAHPLIVSVIAVQARPFARLAEGRPLFVAALVLTRCRAGQGPPLEDKI